MDSIQTQGTEAPAVVTAQEAHNAEMAAVGEQLDNNSNPEALRPSGYTALGLCSIWLIFTAKWL